MSHYQHRASKSRRIIGPMMLVGTLLGAALMFGALFLVNRGLPFPVPTATATMPPTPTESTSPVPVDDTLTDPGSKMPFDTPATVLFSFGKDGQKSAAISLTAGKPRLASEKDLSLLVKATPQLTGMVVYYIPVTITKVSGDELAGRSLESVIFAVTETGLPLQELTITDWLACESGRLPAQIDQVGTPVQQCFAAAATQEFAPAVAAQFSQLGGSYDSSVGGAVTWGP